MESERDKQSSHRHKGTDKNRVVVQVPGSSDAVPLSLCFSLSVSQPQWACVSYLLHSLLLALGYRCVPLCDWAFLHPPTTGTHTCTHGSLLFRSLWVLWSKLSVAEAWRTRLITTAVGEPCHPHWPYPAIIITINMPPWDPTRVTVVHCHMYHTDIAAMVQCVEDMIHTDQ